MTDILFENNNNGIGMPATSSLDQELPTGKVPRFKAYFLWQTQGHGGPEK